jgi:hypothetical protein
MVDAVALFLSVGLIIGISILTLERHLVPAPITTGAAVR